MKELLKNRTFKNNLRKWLFMYVCTIGLLTSAITYSRYVSQFMSKASEAVVAKFNVKIEHEDACKNITGLELCNADLTRPLEEYPFYFSVDTSEVEVAANIVITPKINQHENVGNFSIKEIWEVKTDENGNGYTNLNSITPISQNGNYSFSYQVNPGDAKKYFKIILQHAIDSNEYNGSTSALKVLSIGYSAEQID